MSNLQAFLTQKDTFLLDTADASIPARERQALVLASQVTPDPGSAHDLDWLLREAATGENCAKFVHVEHAAGFVVFVFRDRSILATLESGAVYAMPNGSPDNILKLIDWLQHQGIVEHGITRH